MLLVWAILFLPSAWADPCPSLAGVYHCPKNGTFDAFTLTLTQRDVIDEKLGPITEYKFTYSTFMEYSLTRASPQGVWNHDEELNFFAKCVGNELQYSDKEIDSDVKRRYLQRSFVNSQTGSYDVFVNDRLVITCAPKSPPAIQK